MEVIFEIFCTFAASMTIINPKDLYIWPVLHYWQFIHWMYYVKNYCYPILIVLANKSNVGIGTE